MVDFDERLGLLDCLLLSIGGMVGSAIFVFPGTTGQLVGPTAIFAWVVAGVLMLTIALCYTELALAFPETGSPAIFPAETFGPYPLIRTFASYLEGVGYALGWVFGITISALAIADYLAILLPGAGGYVIPIALLAIGLAAVVNLLGIDVATRTNLLLSAFLLSVLVTFAAAGFAHAQPTNYRPLFEGDRIRFLAAVQVALTAYGAWTVIPASIEEVANPARTVPRAILLSLTITTILYATIVAAIHGVVSPVQFTEGSATMTAPLGVAASALGSTWLRNVLAVAAVTAIFTTILVGIMSAGRVLFALGQRNTLPSAFAATGNRFQVPWIGIVVVTVAAGALAAVPRYFYELLVIASVIGTGLPYAINILSFIGLRYYRSDVEPSFRAPGGYALPVVAFVALAVAMLGLGSTEMRWSLGALALLGSYFLIRVVFSDNVVTEASTETETRP